MTKKNLAHYLKFFWKTESFSQSFAYCQPFHLSIYHSSPSFGSIQYFFFIAVALYVCLCLCAYVNVRSSSMCVCVITVLFKEKKKKKSMCSQSRQNIFWIIHIIYFFFISNGYLFALCLKERNKYKNVCARIHIRTLTCTFKHTHANRTYINTQKDQSTNQPTQWYHAVRFKQQ